MQVRRRLTVLFTLTAILGLLLGASPAATQAETFQFRGNIAPASWSFDDAFDTEVFASAIDGTRHDSPGPPEEFTGGFVGVAQNFCDTAEDELVFRSSFSSGEGFQVDFQPRLESATLEGQEVAFSGFESRVPDCDDPDFDSGQFNDLGTVSADVALSWQNEGREDTDVSHFSFREPPRGPARG